jgi:hypothetical protein
MHEGNREALTKAWIGLQKSQKDTAAYQENFWAQRELWQLVNKEPNEAWEVILCVIRSTSDDWILENLGAGPLEDLFVVHGDKFIDIFEQLATADPAFCRVANFIWKNEIRDDIWKRIQKIATMQ